jgi:hypothetical protein
MFRDAARQIRSGTMSPFSSRTTADSMQWNDLVINGATKSMAHLQPFEMIFDVAGQPVPHNSRKGGQRYFCLDLHEHAIFFSISKPVDTTHYLRLHVISAYVVENWGRHSLPKGKPYNVRYILKMRNEGNSV